MIALFCLPPILSLLVLAAHFYRAGHVAIAILSILLTGLLAVPRPWAARTLQAALLLGCAEWIRTAEFFVTLRRDAGRPWGRLAIILAAVALLTALSALVFESRRMKKRFGLEGSTQKP
ncbi:MAG: hypothetical protein ACHQPI_07045 [Thermoanaerobaculia bacterium]